MFRVTEVESTATRADESGSIQRKDHQTPLDVVAVRVATDRFVLLLTVSSNDSAASSIVRTQAKRNV